MKTIKLALIGYGNAGKAFNKMLNKKRTSVERKYNIKVDIVAICTKSRGIKIDEDGIDTDNFTFEPNDDPNKAFKIIDEVDYDVLVEITPINIMSGQPAIDHIKHAINRGKHVITANKGPIAWAYKELKALADEKGVFFYHETTVMDGIPIFNLQSETLRECEILEIKGILNSTTNFVLNEMSKGVSYDDAVKDGKNRGFVEADPAMDLDGWDAAAKLTALMNVFMDAGITPKDIIREGISGITQDELNDAKKNNQKIKLLCHGKIQDGKPVGRVVPTRVDIDNMFATINGTAAAVTLTTDLVGDISIIEHVYEPEIDQTAYGILSDLVRTLQG